MWDDGWTVLTADGSWVAQWEHTLAVTDDGAEILTLPTPPRAPDPGDRPRTVDPTHGRTSTDAARSDTIASYTEICRIR